MEMVNYPTCHRFALTPQHNKELTQFIHDVKWKAVSKQLRIVAIETPDLAVFQLMEYMRDRQKEVQSGPFVNLEEDALLLQMFDKEGKVIGSLKFKNLSLVGHRCHFDMTSVGNLCHTLTIQYQEVKKL
jgi:hypothetical protein